MCFELRIKKKSTRVKETKTTLKKAQKEMKQYTNKKRVELVEYKVEDQVLLSMKKNLIFQIEQQETEINKVVYQIL